MNDEASQPKQPFLEYAIECINVCLRWTLVATPIGCFLGFAGTFAWKWLSRGQVSDGVLLLPILAVVAALVGMIPALVYGAPLYALSAATFRPSLFAAILIGAFPGLSAIWSNVGLDPYRSQEALLSHNYFGHEILWCGIGIAAALHFLVRKKLLALSVARESTV
ncbi:hypothetical protein C7S18_02880 [Ahniella affigens]|uniref:Uncharacterized protein n=1 Tax=Ahniella affigens TaxID=2021234 RepID=A0A2P1PMY2_9GAMM|nr:hypothetical protein [Ahniella affigens]AVP96199.1 hypothetical protein C7S18_02880 [Ahniella affigens]